MSDISLKIVSVERPEGVNVILGQTHFIKSVEDIYEAISGGVPGAKFGLAFSESSGHCLVRSAGNDQELVDLASKNLMNISAGHIFLVMLRNLYPINVLNSIKNVPEVCNIYCATANPVNVVLAGTREGRGVLGVIDGQSPIGIESKKDAEERRTLLRKIGYKL